VNIPTVESLPAHVPEQIALYQGDHLLTHPAFPFDPRQVASAMQDRQQVVAVDLGGDKIRRATYTIERGILTQGPEEVLQARGGAGYLAFLERLAAEAAETGIPVGISSATRLEGTVISRTVNLPVFFQEFSEAYGADYARLFPSRSFVANDTVAGICGASTLLALKGNAFRDIAFIICGSGLGASVIANGIAIHVEAAHVPLVDRLNPLGQGWQCNVEGKDYVCLERVTAARAGIEDLYQRQTGLAADGVALGAMWERGDPLATLLYETSALALAHATAGVIELYAFPATPHGVVVYHGGNFELAAYRQAIAKRLASIPCPQPQVIFSRDLSPNVCLDGAAVLAVHAGTISG
jgi:predicted NBD/HSP70 family sugar kinase